MTTTRSALAASAANRQPTGVELRPRPATCRSTGTPAPCRPTRQVAQAVGEARRAGRPGRRPARGARRSRARRTRRRADVTPPLTDRSPAVVRGQPTRLPASSASSGAWSEREDGERERGRPPRPARRCAPPRTGPRPPGSAARLGGRPGARRRRCADQPRLGASALVGRHPDVLGHAAPLLTTGTRRRRPGRAPPGSAVQPSGASRLHLGRRHAPTVAAAHQARRAGRAAPGPWPSATFGWATKRPGWASMRRRHSSARASPRRPANTDGRRRRLGVVQHELVEPVEGPAPLLGVAAPQRRQRRSRSASPSRQLARRWEVGCSATSPAMPEPRALADAHPALARRLQQAGDPAAPARPHGLACPSSRGRHRRRRRAAAPRRPAPARPGRAATPGRPARPGRRPRRGCSRGSWPGRCARSSRGGRHPASAPRSAGWAGRAGRGRPASCASCGEVLVEPLDAARRGRCPRTAGARTRRFTSA